MKHISPPEKPQRPDIEYPCIWTYKVIGRDCTLLKDAIIAACAPLEPVIRLSNSSSGGKYHSLNAELEVPNEEVRLKTYQALKSNPAVKIIL